MSNIEVVEGLDYVQKAQIKWGIEVDENSKNFHGMLKRRCIHMQIQGVLSDGEWIDEPSSVKHIFFDFYATNFNFFGFIPIIERIHRYNILSNVEADFIQSQLTEMEIREAVWSCGSDRAPGPNGFYFRFIKKYWEILKFDVFGFVQEFFDNGFIPIGCNSAFINLIPKVDNPL